jgi:hypothetical protein
LDRLECNKFAVKDGDTVLANVIAVSGMNSKEILFGEQGGRGEAIEKEVGVGVVSVSRNPIEGSRNGTSTRGGANERASNKLGRRVGSVDGSKEVDID